MKTFPSSYNIHDLFTRYSKRQLHYYVVFSQYFFCHLTRPNSIFNKKLIALDILEALVAFLLNNSAVWYRCLFQEKHLTFPFTKAGKFLGQGQNDGVLCFPTSRPRVLQKRNMASGNHLVFFCQEFEQRL